MIKQPPCSSTAQARQSAFFLVALGTIAFSAAACNAVFGIHEGKPRPVCMNTNRSEDLIDDMEDTDGFICTLSGRSGHWYATNDQTPGSVVIPAGGLDPERIPGGRGTSQFAAHFMGAGSTKWGAAMGFPLKVAGAGTTTVDVHTVTGLTFWMKSSVPVTVNFRTPETMSPANGGHCVDDGNAVNCNNDFGFAITAPSADWKEYRVPFDALQQLFPGGSATWNPRFLDSIQFNAGPGAPFDVWVDDVRFFYCQEVVCLPTCAPDWGACPATDDRPSICIPPGTDCAAVVSWCADPLMIDDMEDADGSICNSGGRHGEWSTNGHDSVPNPEAAYPISMQTLIPGGRGASHYAAHLAGQGLVGLARMGIELNTPEAGAMNYDGSKYAGIRFWLKSDVPIIVGFTSPETLPVSQNGTCDLSPTQENCNHHYEVVAAATGGEWLDYKVAFSELRQVADHGAPVNVVPPNATWNSAHMRAIAFLTSSPDFDVWIDDLAFYGSVSEVAP